jgi:hypothetical protein
MGERLGALRPDERRNEMRFKEIVHQAATEIGYEYLAEIAPLVGGLEIDRLLAMLPGNVLNRHEMEKLFFAHALATGGEEKHVFSALYHVGLLGHVHHDRARGDSMQRFLRPGEATLAPDGQLPPSTHYLLHPVLSDVIGRLNPEYLKHIDRTNIIGYGRPWFDKGHAPGVSSAQSLCVLMGDVHDFGGLMHARADDPVRTALATAVSQWSDGAIAADTRSGDSVLIVHEDPVALAQTARHIMDDVYQVAGQPRLRIALHFGEVKVRRTGDAPSVAGGTALLCASRVEPHVAPGQIWATEEFREQLAQRPSLWRTTEVAAPDGGDRFNVKKEGKTEPDLWVRLYRLEF